MAINKTVGYLTNGTAGDYTTSALYDAAWGVDGDMPTTFTQDQTAQVWYSDNAQNKVWGVQFEVLASLTTGDFSLTIQGMVGDVASGDQVTITQSSGDGAMRIINLTGYCVVKNIAIVNSGLTTHGIIGDPTRATFKDCFINLSGNAANRSGNTFYRHFM